MLYVGILSRHLNLISKFFDKESVGFKMTSLNIAYRLKSLTLSCSSASKR